MTPAVIVEREAAALRRRLGPVAWCALEVIAAGEATDAAAIGQVLGVGRDRARAAVGVLVDAGLVVVEGRRAGKSGRWAGSTLRPTADAARFVHRTGPTAWGAPGPEIPAAVHPRQIARDPDQPTCDPGRIARDPQRIAAPLRIAVGDPDQLDLFGRDPDHAPADAPNGQAH